MFMLADAAVPTVWDVAWTWFNVFAGVASILSFLLTLYVVGAIRKQHRRLERLAVLPSYNRRLSLCLNQIRSARDRKSEDDLQSGISRFRVILTHMRELTVKETRKELTRQLQTSNGLRARATMS